MTRRSLLLAALAALTVLAAMAGGWYIYQVMNVPSGAPLPPAEEAQHVQTTDGETSVLVAPELQHASGIEVAPLAASTSQPERTAYATVIDLQPLFDLGNRLAAARAARDGARAQAETSHAQAERTQALYQDDHNASLKSLQEALAAAQADQARLRTAEAAHGSVAASLRLQFGDVLTSAAAAPTSGLFRRLSDGTAAVVRVTLPAPGDLPVPADIVLGGPDGRAVATRKLSAAPQIDPAIQGTSYFYLAERVLPVGTRMVAHLPLGERRATGLLIPENAIVWYGGQRWIYVRMTADRFVRRPVFPIFATDDGVIVTSGFRAGEAAVIRGAQLLLSEEQRPQSLTPPCKDPPECDG